MDNLGITIIYRLIHFPSILSMSWSDISFIFALPIFNQSYLTRSVRLRSLITITTNLASSLLLIQATTPGIPLAQLAMASISFFFLGLVDHDGHPSWIQATISGTLRSGHGACTPLGSRLLLRVVASSVDQPILISVRESNLNV